MAYQMFSSSLVVFGLLISLALACCHTIPNENVLMKKKINEKVFATSGNGLTPTETFELLQLLDRFYTHIATENKNGAEHKQVKSLITMGDTRRVHCGYMDLSGYDSLIETSSESELINIVGYLKHFKNQAFLSCKNVLEILHETEKESDDDAEEMKRYRALRESIRSANGGAFERQKPLYTEEALNKGIESYIESNVKNDEIGEDKQQVVTKLCERVQERRRFSSRMFAQIINDYESLVEQLEPELFEALVDFKICRDIEQMDKRATA